MFNILVSKSLSIYLLISGTNYINECNDAQCCVRKQGCEWSENVCFNLNELYFLHNFSAGSFSTIECANYCVAHPPCVQFSIDFVSHECVLVPYLSTATYSDSASASVWNVVQSGM
jgi:hypothetical protein